LSYRRTNCLYLHFKASGVN